MNEQALSYAYELFKADGYGDSLEDFVTLINSNPNALQDSYALFKGDGYGDSIEDYGVLLGVKKKDEPVQEVTEFVLEDGSSESASPQDIRARELRQGVTRQNPDGTESTVLMAAEKIDGKNVAFPTLFPTDPDNFSSDPATWTQYDDHFEAYEEAVQRGEVFEFDDWNDALAFGEGSWKPSGSGDSRTPERGLIAEAAPVSPLESTSVSMSTQEDMLKAAQVGEKLEVDTDIKGDLLAERGSGFSHFDRALTTISDFKGDVLTDYEEEFVVPKLNYTFGQYGFEFEEVGLDAMRVTANNGETLRIGLDNPLNIGDKKNAKELQDFLRRNKDETLHQIKQEELRVLSNDEITSTVKIFNQETKAFSTETNDFAKRYGEFLAQFQVFENYSPTQIANDPELKRNYAEGMRLQREYQAELNKLREQEKHFASQGARLDRIAGEYAEMQSKQGTTWGGLINKFASGAIGTYGKSAIRAMTGIGADIMFAFQSDATEAKFLREQAKEMGIDVPDGLRPAQVIEFIKDLDTQTTAATVPGRAGPDGYAPERTTERTSYPLYEKMLSKAKDVMKKDILYDTPRYRNAYSAAASTTDTTLGMIDAVELGTREYFMSSNTTEQWEDLQSQEFWTGAILGLAESLPAMLGSGPLGWAQRTAQMYSLSTEHVYEEMEQDAAFDNISESEKFLVTAPIGIAVGILEAYGFRNLTSSSPLVLNLVSRALTRSSKNTTAKTFGEFIKNDIKSRGGKFIAKLGAAGAAEFETGLAQEMAEIGVKDIYNQVKDKGMFQTPDTFKEYVGQILRAGAQEAIGGFILGAPGAVSAAYASGNLEGINEGEWALFRNLATNPEYKDMYLTKLATQHSAGEITEEQRKEKEAQVDKLLGLLPQVPTDMNPQQQKETLSLLLQKQELESEIEGKDEALVKNQKRRIAAINAKLEEVSDQAYKQQQEQREAAEGIPDFGDVSSKTQEETTEGVTEEEQSDVEDFFGDNTEETTEPMSENLSLNRKGSFNYDAAQQRIRKAVIVAAKLGAKSISKILPNVRVVLHESNDEYLKFDKDGDAGTFAENVIHINLSKAGLTTVPHEIFHAVFIEKVKTDVAAAKAAETMMLSVRKTLKDDSELAKRIDAFAAGYTGDQAQFQNEERLAELVAILSSEYRNLNKPAKNKVIQFLKDFAKRFNIDLGSDFGKTDESVIDLLNTLSRKVREGEVIEESDLTALEELDDGTNPVGNPTEITPSSEPRKQKRLTFKDSYPLSRISGANKVDIDALIKEISDSNQKVWFWVADQLGVNEVLDGGPSFALQEGDAIWASSMAEKAIEENIKKSDYLFIMSGSPTQSLLFNKSVFDLLTAPLGDFASFKEQALTTNPTKALRETLEAHDSWESLRDDSSTNNVKSKKIGTGRKKFLRALYKSETTPNTKLHALIQSLGGYTNLNELRDGFYQENGFEQNDIMLVLKPTGVKKGSDHSTYENTVTGEVIGVPDVKIDALEIMPEAMREKYSGKGRAKTSQAVAPYGSGVKAVAPRKQKAPNGKPSKLTPEQYELVRTPAFKKWFGDWETDPENSSKVLDRNGEPQVANHYSDSSTIEAFKMKNDEGYVRAHSLSDGGIYFNLGETEAKYGRYGYYVFLNFRNPLYVKNYKSDVINPYTKKKINLEEITDEDIRYLDENGYDSLIGSTGQVVAFSSNQAKLADGSNTTFDASKPSIRKQKAPKDLTPKEYIAAKTQNRKQKVLVDIFDVKDLEVVSKGGTSRNVYMHPDGDKVIKVAKSPKGLEQNIAMGFGDVDYLGSFVPVLEEQGLDYIIVENVPRNDKEVRQFLKPLKEFTPIDFKNKTVPLQDALRELGLEGFMDYNILWNDFTAPRNWGMRDNGEFVLVDEGALDDRIHATSEVQTWAKQEWNEVKGRRRTPAPRKQQVQKLAQMYNMNDQGFMPRTTQLDQARRAFAPYGLGVAKGRDDGYGRGGGVYLTRNGRKYNPFKDVSPRKQKTVTIEDSVVGGSAQSFEDGSMKTFTVDGGTMEIGKVKGVRNFSILHLSVNEDSRRQGKGTELLKSVLDYTKGMISGMASKDAAVELNYKLGMRAVSTDGKELSLEQTKEQRSENAGESIRMQLPDSKKGDNYKDFGQEVTPAPRKQKSMNEIIEEGRQANFRDAVLRDYLVRVRKLKATVVDAALEVSRNLFEKLPDSFKNMQGGVQAGEKLFKKVEAYREKLERRNARSKYLTPAEIDRKVASYANDQRGTYDSTTQLTEKVEAYRTKLTKSNNRRRNPLSQTELRAKVAAYRAEITEQRNVDREAARKKVNLFHRNEIRNNKKRVRILSEQEIMDALIEYMQAQPEYIKEGDTYQEKGKTKYRKGISTQQAQMVIDLQRGVGLRPTQDMSAKIRRARIAVRERMKGQRDLQSIKRALRNFIRVSLPAELYTKREVLSLIKKIELADRDNIENLMNEITDFVISKNVARLEKSIADLLNDKYTKLENGRKKGVKIDVETMERLESIKKRLAKKDTSAEDIASINALLQSKWNELSKKPDATLEELMEMVNLQIIIEMNNSLVMEDTDSNKVSSLDDVLVNLTEMVEFGRTALQAELAEAKEKYDRQFEIAYKEITGKKIDLTEEGAKERLERNKTGLENETKKKETERKVKAFFRGVLRNAGDFLSSNEALDGLMDKISMLPGELFGGALQELVTARVDNSSRNFKERQMYVSKKVEEKLVEIYGNKWKKSIRENRNPINVFVVNQEKLDEAQKNYDANPENADLKKALDEAVLNNEKRYSQNQMAYLYNQHKDPANDGAFEAMYGSRYKEILAEIEVALDPDVKAFADWQVNELFPELYEHYNEAYKKNYRTNMPWNEFYAGRIYRDGVDAEPLDLLSGSTNFHNAVNGASTRARVQNNTKISAMDGMDALMSYIHDMEYFAAYAETIRDIDKLFTNEYVANAITQIHGKRTLELITSSIKKIANKGVQTEQWAKWMNSVNTMFIVARLAISPLIMIKQLTSTFTYANDIGVVNWLKYSAKNIPELRSVFAEMRDNSVYMQERGTRSLMRAIETYSESAMQEFVPSPTKDFMVDFMMYLVKFGDRNAIFLGGASNYSYYKDQALKEGRTEQEAIDIAIQKFERDTKRTQQSSDLQDKDIYQTGHPFQRAANFFLSTPRQYLRKDIQAMRSLFRKMAAWDKNAGKGSRGENVRTLLMYHIYMPLLFQYVSMGLPGLLRGWREDDDEDLMRAAIIGPLNGLFVAGEIIAMSADYYQGKPWAGEGTKSLGVLNVATSIIQKLKRADRLKPGPKKDAAMKKAYLELMTIPGIPAPTLDKLITNYRKVIEGDYDNAGEALLRLMNFSEYQISGPKKDGKESKTIEEINEDYDRQLRKEEKEMRRQQRLLEDNTGRGTTRGGEGRSGERSGGREAQNRGSLK